MRRSCREQNKEIVLREVRERAVLMLGEDRADYGWVGSDNLDCSGDQLHCGDAAPLVPGGGEPTNGTNGAGWPITATS